MCLSKLVINGHLGRRWHAANAAARRYASMTAGPSKLKGTLAGAWTDGKKYVLTDWGQQLDKKSKGRISAHIAELSSHLKLGNAFIVNDVLPDEYSGVAITCLGPAKAGYNALEALDEARENTRIGVGAAAALLQQNSITSVDLDPCKIPDAAAEGQKLADWNFGKWVKEVNELKGDGKGPTVLDGYYKAESQNWARYFCELPPDMASPKGFAKRAQDRLTSEGIKVQVQPRDWMVKQGMEALLAVADGSCEPPVFLECVYTGDDPKKPPVLLTAKGITFDSGGLCLFPPKCLIESRATGLAGAAVAVAALWGIACLKAKVNVACVVPLCENMISGHSIRVGDEFKVANGTKIQVERTDLAAHLILADALTYGQKTYKPSLVVNVAALTRTIMTGIGAGAFGCFTNNDKVWTRIQHAGAISGDRPWRLPIWDYYKDQLSYHLDGQMRNTGPDKSTTCLGAAFLKTFVPGDFLHMDITGVGLKDPASRGMSYLNPRYMTGRPTRTLIEFLSGNEAKGLMQSQSRGGRSQNDLLTKCGPDRKRESWFAMAKAGLGLKASDGRKPTESTPRCGPSGGPDPLCGIIEEDPPVVDDPQCGIIGEGPPIGLKASDGRKPTESTTKCWPSGGPDPLCGIIGEDPPVVDDPQCGIIGEDPKKSLAGAISGDGEAHTFDSQPNKKCPACGTFSGGDTPKRSGQKPLRCPACGQLLPDNATRSGKPNPCKK